jgi:alpha-beta hydrolase superfamily lysophospholipase
VLAGHRFGHRQRIEIPLFPALYTRSPRWIDYVHDDPHRVLTASTRFYWETRRLDWARERLAAQLRLPVMLQMGTADRIADADATAAWVDRLPTLDRTSYLYAGASHTLDFEPEPLVSVYRADLFAWLDRRIGDAAAWETTHAS